MSQVREDAKAIRGQMEADVLEAWPDVREIIENDPRKPAEPPYAVVALRTIPMQFNAARSKLHTLEYEIYGRFPFPDEGSLEDAKLDRLQSLMDLLEANPTYATVGLIPIVTSVAFDESDEEDEPYYELVITFEVKTDTPHGAAEA